MAHTVNNNVWISCAGGEGPSPVGDDALGKCWRSSDRRASLEAGDNPPLGGPISLSVTPSIPQGKEIPRYSTLSLSLQVQAARIAPFLGSTTVQEPSVYVGQVSYIHNPSITSCQYA